MDEPAETDETPLPSPLEGKVAVVTGASRGIGAAVARSLGGEGAFVVGVARTQSELEATLADVPRALGFPADVSDPAAVSALFRRVGERYGRLDVLVNSAGVLHRAPLADTTDEQWAESLAVNLTGVFLCCRQAVRLMSGQAPTDGVLRGHIVQIVSGAGVHGWEGSGAYSASKFGLMGLSEVLREEVRGLGIKVTDVLPGMVETSMTDLPEFAARVKLTVEDVAQAVLAVLTTSPRAVMRRVDLRNL